MHPFRIVVPCCLAVAAAAQSVQHHVVPASATTTDANSFQRLAGASAPLRQQSLIAAHHLAGMVGRTLTALEFRRTAADEAYQGGAATLTVTLSHAAHGPLEASRAFFANVGANAVVVHQGVVAAPNAPAVPGGPGAAVAWTAANIVRIPFTTPFVYLGGPLCVDVTGAPVAGQETGWWMADAVAEPIAGTTTELGGGCGAFGGVSKQWSHVGKRSLLPGAYAQFEAYGPPGSLGLCVFGARAAQPVPLAWLGFNSPAGCNLLLASIDAVELAVFAPETEPGLMHRGGLAALALRVPADPSAFGATMTTQWFDWSQQATSNAIEWTVANAAPGLGMALLEGHPQEALGQLSVHLAPVLRFESQ